VTSVHFYQQTFKETPEFPYPQNNPNVAYNYLNGWHYDYFSAPTSVQVIV
jgi:hypothetical protein